MESHPQWWIQLKANVGERYAFKRIKSDAAAVRREFTITLEWFIEACHKPCHYCNRSNRNSLTVKSRAAGGGYVVKDFRYNGVDRVDNSVGYTPKNCVPCCIVCNRAKGSMTYGEFWEYLSDLVNFRTTGEYHEPDIRAVSLSPLRRGSEAGHEVKTQFSAGGYIPSFRNDRRVYGGGCYYQEPREPLPVGTDSLNSQEEEPDED